MINQVTLVGRLGKDAELKTTNSGTEVANFTLATTEYAGKDKEQKTSWHNVVLWGKAATSIAQYLTKGTMVGVMGRVEYQQWEKDGQKHFKTVINAGQVRLLGGNKRDASDAQQREMPDDTPMEW